MATYLIAAGVNHGPGGAPLHFAEKDAADVFELMTSARCPFAESHASLLTGRLASKSGIRAAFLKAMLAEPDVLLVFFAGHGSEEGVLASDGLLHFKTLIHLLRLVDAPKTVVVLDVCRAASYLDFVKEAQLGGMGSLDVVWLKAVARATPGSRLIFSTAANRNAGEGQTVSNGHFTHAWLEALRRGAPDLHHGGTGWISDQHSFALARWILENEMGIRTQNPVERGLTGELPLAVSESDSPLGLGFIARAGVVSGPGDLSVEFEVYDRKGLETEVVIEARNHRGMTFWSQRQTIQPGVNESLWSGRIEFPRHALDADPVSTVSLLMYGRTEWTWVLRIHDRHGRVLDEKAVQGVWHAR